MEALLNQFIKFYILIHLITQAVSFNCDLNYNEPLWLGDWYIILKRDGNNQLQLLRNKRVAGGENIILSCNNNRQPVTVGCIGNQQFSRRLPLEEQCTEDESLFPAESIETVPYCRYTLYKIGFNVNINGRTQFYETYRVCFDGEHMRTVFTINTVYPVGGSRPEFLQFNPDDIFNGRYFNAFNRPVIFRRFKHLLGDDQPYMNERKKEHIINRGHLTPSADFTSINLKRSTFKLINAMPQFNSIDGGNWRLIENWIRGASRTPGNVCTGVLECNLDSSNIQDLNCVVQLRHTRGHLVPMFLADDRKIPIPLWSYKIVRNNEGSFVFLMLNNIYHTGPVVVPPRICQEVTCPLTLDRDVTKGWTLCCSYNEFIANNVPHLRNVC